MSLPPGPRAPSLVITYNWIRRPFELMDSYRARYGETFSMRLAGLPPFVVFSNPNDVREIFADDGEAIHAGKFNLTLRAFLGEHSVLMLDGKEHMRQRKLLLPPFHGERMHAYGPAMLDVTDSSIDSWPIGRRFPIHRYMQSITLDVIVRALFGVDDAVRFERVRKVLTEVLDIAAWPPLLIPYLQVDLGPRSPWGRFLRKMAEAEALLREEIARRRREGARGRSDVLSMLIVARDDAGEPMSDAELRDELVTLLVAGHETTATGLAWAFRWILDDPSIHQRLVEEIATAEREGPLTGDRIARLELVDAVAREALRLQPVLPIVGRVLQKPMRLGGWDLPAGTGVLCSIYLAQRRAEAFPSPTRFDPDRFLGKKPSASEFFPFGGGIRRCIGMAFALYEMKIVLARVLSRVSLRLDRSAPIRVVRRSITLTPSDGLLVHVDAKKPRVRVTEAA